VEDMQVPVEVGSARWDILAYPIDVKNLEPKLSILIYHKISSYNHLGFVLGLDAFFQVYSEITIISEAQWGWKFSLT
jgi:hypothetical protein